MSNRKTKAARNEVSSYVLIDFENVQPKNLGLLEGKSFKVLVFVGSNQKKIPMSIVKEIQNLGDNGEYIEITGSGPNALDFHITYYLGQLVAAEPKAHYFIVTRDKGFNPLIKHLKARNIRVQGIKDLVEIPALRISTKTEINEKIDRIVKVLAGMGQHRPRKVKPLQNLINNLIAEELGESELTSLVEALRRRKLIVVKDNKVSYKLPS